MAVGDLNAPFQRNNNLNVLWVNSNIANNKIKWNYDLRNWVECTFQLNEREREIARGGREIVIAPVRWKAHLGAEVNQICPMIEGEGVAEEAYKLIRLESRFHSSISETALVSKQSVINRTNWISICLRIINWLAPSAAKTRVHSVIRAKSFETAKSVREIVDSCEWMKWP